MSEVNATSDEPLVIRLFGRAILICRKIGEGGYAYVFEVEDMNNGERFCLKKMNVRDPEARSVAMNEINVMRKIRHRNVLYALEFTTERSFSYLLMELCLNGNLLNMLQAARTKHRAIPERNVINVIRDIADALAYLHKTDITHRDLKPENVLIDRNNVCRLCDFGSSVFGVVPLRDAKDRMRLQDFVEKSTTLMYRAPEMADLFSVRELTSKVDIWSFGCIAYSLVYLNHPFNADSNLAIINSKISYPENYPYSTKLMETIRRMLVRNPLNRSSSNDIVACIRAIEENAPLPPEQVVTDSNIDASKSLKNLAVPSTSAFFTDSSVQMNSIQIQPGSVAARRLAARQKVNESAFEPNCPIIRKTKSPPKSDDSKKHFPYAAANICGERNKMTSNSNQNDSDSNLCFSLIDENLFNEPLQVPNDWIRNSLNAFGSSLYNQNAQSITWEPIGNLNLQLSPFRNMQENISASGINHDISSSAFSQLNAVHPGNHVAVNPILNAHLNQPIPSGMFEEKYERNRSYNDNFKQTHQTHRNQRTNSNVRDENYGGRNSDYFRYTYSPVEFLQPLRSSHETVDSGTVVANASIDSRSKSLPSIPSILPHSNILDATKRQTAASSFLLDDAGLDTRPKHDTWSF